jgi:hypothetical protein
MNNGLSAATKQNALQENSQQNAQAINNTLHQIGSATPNAAGLAEDLTQQSIMSNAQVSSNLAAADQQAKMQGASALQGETQIANPLTQVYNTLNQNQANTNGGTSSQGSTTSNSNTQNQGTQGTVAGNTQTSGGVAVAQGNTNGTSNSTTTQNPGFGSFLGSLLGMAGGAMTGGAAGPGGVGNILSNL